MPETPDTGSGSRPRRRILREFGFFYATLVGLTWGLPLSTGRVVRHGDLIVLSGLPHWAYRRGGTTVGRVYLTGDNTGERVLVHETVHVEQWRRLGMWFPLLYWLAGANPMHNRFEVEAGLEDGGYLRRRRPMRRPVPPATVTSLADTPETSDPSDAATTSEAGA
ncbi:Fe-S oxidoreductase [Naasia lichenicola]|uniref:Fe-S oxidoreductase n=1 Tax=Naasia lichenicola TaxID=2565933 RepID=UPI001E55F2BC|nr:Fe-S oxidoreductase [Naasia lichenicola]